MQRQTFYSLVVVSLPAPACCCTATTATGATWAREETFNCNIKQMKNQHACIWQPQSAPHSRRGGALPRLLRNISGTGKCFLVFLVNDDANDDDGGHNDDDDDNDY